MSELGTPAGEPAGPILVTGAEGFVGRHLTAALRTRWPNAAIAAPAFDVRDESAAASIIAGTVPSHCVHLAAISSVMQAAQDQARAWQVNLHGALNVGHAILRHAPDCQMLFVSSADAYGASFRAGVALDETAPLAPMTLYGATKAAADLALGVMATQGLRVVRLRAFNHIGIGQSPEFAVASFARQLARIANGTQEPVLQVGRLDTYRDFLDVRDVCAAYIACLERHRTIPPGTILNIASGQPRRIGDVLQDLIDLAGVRPDVQAAPTQVRPTDILRASGDAGLARVMLGWQPVIAWRQTLDDILRDAARLAAPRPDAQ